MKRILLVIASLAAVISGTQVFSQDKLIKRESVDISSSKFLTEYKAIVNQQPKVTIKTAIKAQQDAIIFKDSKGKFRLCNGDCSACGICF